MNDDELVTALTEEDRLFLMLGGLMELVARRPGLKATMFETQTDYDTARRKLRVCTTDFAYLRKVVARSECRHLKPQTLERAASFATEGGLLWEGRAWVVNGIPDHSLRFSATAVLARATGMALVERWRERGVIDNRSSIYFKFQRFFGNPMAQRWFEGARS